MVSTICVLRHQLVFCYGKDISPVDRKILSIDDFVERTVVTGIPS